MLSFDQLKNLDVHLSFLRNKVRDHHTLFLVWGCVRDTLLWLPKKLIDIDFTMAGTPQHLNTLIDTHGLSHFMTEKFGTITLIKPSKIPIKYELTPLRTEGDYHDARHPDTIKRSNDILLDSARRDFTINCLYYTTTSLLPTYTQCFTSAQYLSDVQPTHYAELLTTYGFLYFQQHQLLIVQDHTHIAKLFPEGSMDEKYLHHVLGRVPIVHNRITSLKTNKVLRIMIDPHHGLPDIVGRKLEAVGNPDLRFTEDALRILRAIRFVNVLNEEIKHLPHQSTPLTLFDFHKETRNSLKQHSHLLGHIAKERIKEELMKSFTFGNPFGCIALLDEARLLELLFPALYATKHIEQPIRYHPFDIYTHTLLCLLALQEINTDPLVRFAMLYHDVGKVDQFGAYGDHLSKEEIRDILAGPLNHRRSSPEYAKKDFKALGFSNKEITEICRYIAHHHSPEEILFAKADNKEKKARTFLSDAWYERAMHIMDITIADRLWQYNPLQNSSDITEVEQLKLLLKKLHKKEGQFTMKQLVIDGWDIMTTFGLPAGPTIGKLLKKTFERVMTDITTRNTKKQIFGFLKIQIKHLTK